MRTKQIIKPRSMKPKDLMIEQMLGDTFEYYDFECPCGKGTIREEHDNTPGFREHDVWIFCKECEKNWKLDTSKGVRNWELVPIDQK